MVNAENNIQDPVKGVLSLDKAQESVIENPVSDTEEPCTTEWYPLEIPNVGSRPPFGYSKKGGDPNLLVADPVLFICLSTTLDQLDNGISLREATDSFNADLASRGYTLSLSHAGLKSLRVKYRPDYQRKHTPSIHKKPSRDRKSELLIKKKIANLKKSKTAYERKINKLSGVLVEKKEIVEEAKSPVVDLPPMELDKTDYLDDAPIAFEPNPGPQTEFLAAEESEVLYGGAAGGEPVSGFYRLLSPRGVKINYVNCWNVR